MNKKDKAVKNARVHTPPQYHDLNSYQFGGSKLSSAKSYAQSDIDEAFDCISADKDRARELVRLKATGCIPAFSCAQLSQGFVSEHYRSVKGTIGHQVKALSRKADTYKYDANDFNMEGHIHADEILEIINGGNEFNHSDYMAGVYRERVQVQEGGGESVISTNDAIFCIDDTQAARKGYTAEALHIRLEKEARRKAIIEAKAKKAIKRYASPAHKRQYRLDKKRYAMSLNRAAAKPEQYDKTELIISKDMSITSGCNDEVGRSIVSYESTLKLDVNNGFTIPSDKRSLELRTMERHLISISQ